MSVQLHNFAVSNRNDMNAQFVIYSDDAYKTYLREIARTASLSSTAVELLNLFTQKESNTFLFDDLFYDEYSKRLKLSVSSIRQALRELRNNNFLQKESKSVYVLNKTQLPARLAPSATEEREYSFTVKIRQPAFIL